MNYKTERVKLIHKAAMEIVEKMGMQFHHPKAIEILQSNGIRCEGDKAFFTEEQLMYWIRKAPSTFTLYADDHSYDNVIGGENVNLAPPYGCPYIVDKDGKKRAASTEDYVKLVKLFEANPDYGINGGPMVMPADVDPKLACLAMYYVSVTHSKKSIMIHTGLREYMEAMVKASEVLWGGADELKKRPHLVTIIDVISPMQFAAEMTENLFVLAKAGQAFTVANCSMAGTTSPVTLAGTIALIAAENLPVIALAQMVNPGTPVCLGSQSCTADLASGQIAGGSPEGALCYKYVGMLADFYGLPSRGGGAISDSKLVDAQSGYESMMTLMSCYQTNMNLVIHSAGILDGYGSTSYEKVLQDFEIIHYVKRFMREFDINEETLPLDEMLEVGHSGNYLESDHTFDWCRVEPLTPSISSRGVVQDPVNQFQLRSEKYMQKLLDSYEKPEVDPEKLEQVKQIFEGVGLSREWMDMVDAL